MNDTPRKSDTFGSRNEQVVRILSILKELRLEGGADLYELAERFGASVRTIRRDLDALGEAGVAFTQRQRPDSQRRRWMIDLQRSQHFDGLFAEGLDAGDNEGPAQAYRLHFDRAVAAKVLARQWHPTQTAQAQPDGSVLLHFTSAKAPEVAAWVASWQHQVVVLEPPGLQTALREFAAWVARAYPR